MIIDKNIFFYGDNLEIMPKYIDDETADLIYLDPPFNSKKAYNIIYKREKSEAQSGAFTDTWTWNERTEWTYQKLLLDDLHAPQRIKQTIKSFHDMLGDNNLMSYLVMMAPRLIEMHRILKKTGSIYLHCDPTSSHYLKIIMDSIFGAKNFRNENVWCYKTSGKSIEHFPRKHDIILFYSKSDRYLFNEMRIIDTGENISRYSKIDSEGNKYYMRSGKYKVVYKGTVPVNDWWSDIPALTNNAKERCGYPTQKPEALLERIIKASSNKGDIVLDPFCGCGTALIVAEKLKRKWIGIDITYLAIDILKERIQKEFRNIEDVDFTIEGEPKGLLGAKEKAKRDKSEYQKWIISKIGGIVNEKYSGDEGIDGFLWFKDGNKEETAIIQETASENVSLGKVRDFGRTIDREKAPVGVFIAMHPPTKGMKKEASKMGVYKDSFGNDYARMQFLTVGEIIEDGGKPNLPQIKPRR